MNIQAAKDNAQHIAGMLVGMTMRRSSFRFSKADRGSLWFSTVAANLVADREPVALFPYRFWA